MQIKCSYSELKDPSLLTANPRNPNKHGERQIELLAKIIDHTGFRHPIVVSKRSGFIVAGHGRLQAAQKLGLSEVPVDYQDFNNEAEEFEFLVADNKIAELADHDDSMMIEGIKELEIEDFELLGLDNFQLELAIEPPSENDDAIPDNVETRCKRGDLWLLGDHRLLCGDSTDSGCVDQLIGNGNRVDLCFTSPPYNVGKSVRGNFYENDGDDKSDGDYVDFLMGFTALSLEYCDYSFVNLQLLGKNKNALIEYQYKMKDHLKDILVWNKSQWPPHVNAGTFGSKWEYVFAFAKDASTKQFPCKWQGKFPNVIDTESGSANEFADVHKATFPVSFPQWVIEKMDFAKSVYDPFCGTGTTLIVCEKLGLSGFGMELDPKYCDVILSRWEKFTGKKAELNGKNNV